jgi:hypothetical protein
VAVGDDVIVNVQARLLGLGTGGFDVLVVNLTRGLDLPASPNAHVVTLPYTPLQAAVRHAEEDDPLASSLDGMPVVCCSLHSQLAPACAGIGKGRRVAYLQLNGGALPVALSDAVRALKELGLLAVAVAVAPCVAGDVQCVSVASALLWAAAWGAEIVVCGIGPGVVGTATAFGHGGLAVADAANAAAALEGRPIVAPRLSAADERERHRGLSHHTRSALALCSSAPIVAWPAGVPVPGELADRELADRDLADRKLADRHVVDTSDWRDACRGLPLSHMGRGPDEDPEFFMAAFAAGRLALELIS